MKRTDTITASACAISDIPAVDIREQQSELISLTRSEGTEVIVDANSCYIKVIKRN
jgi:predicted aconitase with swiveling domain